MRPPTGGEAIRVVAAEHGRIGIPGCVGYRDHTTLTTRNARPVHDEKRTTLVSCLCVTEDRPAFGPWLLWNYRKQDYEPHELVIVDSSRRPALLTDDPTVRIVRSAPGSTVAHKRNLALASARGDTISWFDDDDWQHPRKLSLLQDALGLDGVIAGASRSWFVDLARGRAREHVSHRTVIFNTAAVRRTAVEDVAFDEARTRAADTAWLTTVQHLGRSAPVAVDAVLAFWLCHRENISNPAGRYVFPQPLDSVREAVGRTAWADTDRELAALRDRLDR
jgi:Glycosyl transferase family 2